MKKLSNRPLMNFAVAFKLASFLLFTNACSHGSGDSFKIDRSYAAIVGGNIVSAADPESKSTILVLIYDPATGKAMNCSGTLTQSNLIISAAHCYLELDGRKLPSSSRVFAYFGLSYDGGNAGNNIQELSWDNIVTHPNYKPTTPGQGSANDIALLKLDNPIPKFYEPVPLFSPDIKNSNLGRPVLLAGFGQGAANNEVEKNSPYTLRSMASVIIKNDYIDTQIAVESFPNLYIYHGDSGGPAYVMVEEKLFLLGVCSSGTSGVVAYYESVQQQINWLRSASKLLQVTPSF